MPDISAKLVEQIRSASAEKRQLQIVGRGSKHFYGRTPVGEPLAVAEHEGVVNYHPAELVLTVRGGTSLAEIDGVLAEHGQTLPCELPRFNGDGTIGGSLACNISGPARPWLGSLRDLVLGTKIINGRGELLRFGGQVMKNVAGYDVSRMQAGAMGCLGVIAEVSLKVLPIPTAVTTVVAEIENHKEALTLVNRLSGRSNAISGACWWGGKQYIRFQGARSAVDKAAKEILKDRTGASLMKDGQQFWRDLRDQKLAFFEGLEPLWRFSVGSTADIPGCKHGIIDWGGAQHWIKGDYRFDDLAARILRGMGEVNLFRNRRGDEEVFHPMPAARQAIHKRLKASFDPDFVFNPGRLYSWL